MSEINSKKIKLKFRKDGGALWERNSILMQFVRDIQLGIHVNPTTSPRTCFQGFVLPRCGSTDVFNGGI
jgi:hypothetical protein